MRESGRSGAELEQRARQGSQADGKDEADRWGQAATSDDNGARGLSGEGELGCGRTGCGSAGLLAV